jgi:hypothetical protein
LDHLSHQSRKILTANNLSAFENNWFTVNGMTYDENENITAGITEKVLVSWVDSGSFYEQKGSWSYNPESGILELLFEKESQMYQVNFSENGMIWIPNKQVDEKEILSVLYLRPLGK